MSKKILIIDDEADVRNFLKSFFEDEGFRVVTASDGLAALKIAKEENPDLITLDLQMPHNTGTDFFRKIHRDEKLSHIPLIIISGVPGRHLVTHKPIPVFDKPIDKNELLETVKSLLD